eukprot:6260183-Prymnesium_polylepis.1
MGRSWRVHTTPEWQRAQGLQMLPNPEWLLCWAQGEKHASLQVFGSVDRGVVCTRQGAVLGWPGGTDTWPFPPKRSSGLGWHNFHSCCPSDPDRGRQTEARTPDRAGRSVGRRAAAGSP